MENKCIEPNQHQNPETPMQKEIEVLKLYNACLLIAPSAEQKLNKITTLIDVTEGVP
jgi:hypothetical protein